MAIVDNELAAVETVAGAIPAADLGATLIGEQVVAAPAGHGYWPLDDDAAERVVAAAAGVLTAVRAAGIASLVDVTTIESGRDVALLGKIAERAGLTIVFSTGIDAEEQGVSPAFRALTPVQLADVFIAELGEGVPGSTSRAGAITVARGTRASELDEGAALAAAFAHAETGAPVLARARGEELVALVDGLVGRGIDPERIVACGLDSPAIGWGALEALGKKGVLLGFNSIGDDAIHDDARASLVAYALRRYGSARVAVGSGISSARRELPGVAEAGGEAPGYAALLEGVASFGVPAESVTEATVASARALFVPLREA